MPKGLRGFQKGNKWGVYKKTSSEWHSKLSRLKAAIKMKGDNNPSKRLEVREKISESLRGRIMPTGERAYRWKGGGEASYARRIQKERAEQIKIAGRPVPPECELCLTPASELKKALHFDHNHETGKFRGWLCGSCNSALGLAKESPELLNKMIKYIEKNA
jgi:hypothetical protein